MRCVGYNLSSSQFYSYSEDEADGSHPGGGHDFGTVGDQVEEDRHGGLGSMVEAASEHRRQVPEAEQTDRFRVNQNLLSGTDFESWSLTPE